VRKTLLLVFVLLFMQQVYANLIQGNYRWKSDTGNETSSAWKAPENAGIPNVRASDGLRLRFELYNNEVGYFDLTTIQLFYNDGTTERPVTTSATGAFMLAQSTTTLVDGAETTPQLSSDFDFVPGKVITSSDYVSITLPPFSHTEYEWVIRPGNGIQKARNYTFRIGGPHVTLAEPAGALSTSATLPLKLLSFDAKLADKKVALQWTTTEEENVSHFEVEKSTDGSAFAGLGTVPVKSGTGTKNYFFTDNSVLGHSNYYRLKMVDRDGTFSYSKVSRVKMGGTGNTLSLYPNPAKDRLTISLKAGAGPVNVSLQDASGRTIKTYSVQSDGREINQVADISSLQRGLYFISFNGQSVRFVKE
jgi:hypothetical protein